MTHKEFIILIASNDENTIAIIDNSIKNLNTIIPYSSTTASTDLEVVGCIMKHDIHILMYDVQSSKIDGVKLIETLRQSSIPVLFITNPIQNEEMLKIGFRLNKVDYLTKPLQKELLDNKLNHYHDLFRKEEKIKDDIEFSRAIMDISSSPIFVTDGEQFLYANRLFMSYFEASNIDDLNKSKSIKQLFEKKENYIYSTADNSWLDVYFLHKDSTSSAVMKDDYDNEIVFNIYDTVESDSYNYAIVLQDITNEVNTKRELNDIIYTDINTGLPNRIKLIDDLKHNFLNETAIAVLDIRHFKDINNFYGNQIGNQVLKQIADIIREFTEDFDVPLYKISIDVYAIINTHSLDNKQKDFEEFISNLVDTINHHTLQIEEYEISIEICAGISFSNKTNKLVTSNLALEVAKDQNRPYLVFYEELDTLREYENNLKFIKKIQIALENDDIILYYQPIIDNTTKSIDRYECLVRMIDGDKILSPFEFLQLSKKASLYTKLTKRIIQKAFEKFEHINLPFSINISYDDIVSPNFLEFVKENIEKYNLKGKVIFEIIINDEIKQENVLIEFIEHIKELDCKIAIDNFGEGNFAQVISMGVDSIKIDSKFIKDINTNRNSYLIAKTVVSFANDLGIETVAEHVSSKEIFDTVKELGISHSQGYYFSPPIKEPVKEPTISLN
jgi:diguanylate cyclase (GGDEF)-like protein